MADVTAKLLQVSSAASNMHWLLNLINMHLRAYCNESCLTSIFLVSFVMIKRDFNCKMRSQSFRVSQMSCNQEDSEVTECCVFRQRTPHCLIDSRLLYALFAT